MGIIIGNCYQASFTDSLQLNNDFDSHKLELDLTQVMGTLNESKLHFYLRKRMYLSYLTIYEMHE